MNLKVMGKCNYPFNGVFVTTFPLAPCGSGTYKPEHVRTLSTQGDENCLLRYFNCFFFELMYRPENSDDIP